MVTFRIDIEAADGDPTAVNILLKTETNQAAKSEEESARHLLPALRNLLTSRFPDGDQSPQPATSKIRSNHRSGLKGN